MPYEHMITPTWHNAASPGDFAKTVLMPGDPKRSKWIADHYFEGAVLVNDIRGVQGYTGLYRGHRVSVMASGMGCPAVAIYARELFDAYGVENIIRVGTAGVVDPKLDVMDVVAGTSACTDSNMGHQYGYPYTLSPTASFELVRLAYEAAKRLDIRLHIGPLYCHDMLYEDDVCYEPVMQRMHVLAAEMESAALYWEGMRAGKDALCLCTVTDNPYTGQSSTHIQRERALDSMVRIALELALARDAAE